MPGHNSETAYVQAAQHDLNMWYLKFLHDCRSPWKILMTHLFS